MAFIIKTLVAYVSTGEDGEEGILGMKNPATGEWLPMIGADEERIKSLYPIAQGIALLSGKSFKVMRFSAREDITEEVDKQYGYYGNG